MAKISALPRPVAALSGAEMMPLVKDGQSVVVTLDEVDSAIGARARASIEQAPSLLVDQPNRFSPGELDFTAKTHMIGAGALATTAGQTVEGLGYWQRTVTGGAAAVTAGTTFRFPRTDFGSHVVASVLFLSVDPASSGSRPCRFFIRQRDAGGVEIASSLVVVSGTSGLSVPTRFRHDPAAIVPGCAWVEFTLDCQTAPGGGDRAFRWREMLIASGSNAVFRAPPLLPAPAAAAIGDTDDLTFLTPARAAIRERMVRDRTDGLVRQWPNLFLQKELDFQDKSRLVVPQEGLVPATYATSNGILPCWSFTVDPGSAQRNAQWLFDRAEIVGDVFSASVRVLGVNTPSGGNGAVRWLVEQFAGSTSIGNSVMMLVREEGLPSEQVFEVGGIVIDPACTTIRVGASVVGTGSSTPRTIWFRDMMLAAGTDPHWRAPPVRDGLPGPNGNPGATGPQGLPGPAGPVTTIEGDPLIPHFIVVTEDRAAADGEHLSVDTSDGPLSIYLPAEGGIVTLRDHAGTWDIAPVTIFGTGRTIEGEPSIVADIAGYSIVMQSAGGAWRYAINYLYGGY